MLKFLDKPADKKYITNKGDHLIKNGLPLALRLRKAGEPRQAHVIPELPVIPWENKQERVENRWIDHITKQQRKVG